MIKYLNVHSKQFQRNFNEKKKKIKFKITICDEKKKAQKIQKNLIIQFNKDQSATGKWKKNERQNKNMKCSAMPMNKLPYNATAFCNHNAFETK